MTVSKQFREEPFPDESRCILLRVESVRGKGWGHRADNFKITVDNIQEEFGLQNCSVLRNIKCFYNLQKSLKDQHKIMHCLPHKMLMKVFGLQRKLITLSNFLTKIILSSELRTNQVKFPFLKIVNNIQICVPGPGTCVVYILYVPILGNNEFFTENC